MGWNLDNDTGGNFAEKLQPGVYRVRVKRVLVAKNGEPYRTKNRDRKILVILADADGREHLYDAMLEGPAIWRLNRLMKAVGWTGAELEARGSAPIDLLDQKTADSMLLDRECEAVIEDKENRIDATLNPLKPSTKQIDDDVPF